MRPAWNRLFVAAIVWCLFLLTWEFRLGTPPHSPRTVNVVDIVRETPPAVEEIPDRKMCAPFSVRNNRSSEVDLTLVTAASEKFWNHLTNAVGSFHLWEPTLQIAVYDLGLSEAQLAEVRSWCGVEVVSMITEKQAARALPDHVSNLRNFAWKALVLRDAVERFGKVLYVDSGIELRRSVARIVGDRIDADGYFCVGIGDSLTWGARSPQAEFFNESLETFFGKPLIAGGIHGVSYWGPAYRGLVVPAAECSLSFGCIAPQKVDRGEVRSFGKDQPVFSMRAYAATAAQCAIDPAFTRFSGDEALPQPETVAGRQVLFIRRARPPKPFAKHLLKRSDPTCKHAGGPRNAEAWAKLRDTPDFGAGEPCRCLRSAKSDAARRFTNWRREMLLVTGAGSAMFESLKNFVGSVHKWEPDVRTLIYDRGLSEDERSQAAGWRNSQVIDGKDIKGVDETASWKPLVIRDAVMRANGNPILFLTPTHELRGSLEPLALQLYRDSIFTVTVAHDLLQHSSPESLSASLGIPRKNAALFEFKPLCSMDVFGFFGNGIDGSFFSRRVLEPIASCAETDFCWNGIVASGASTDTVAMSALLYSSTCYTCNRDTPYHAYGSSVGTAGDPTDIPAVSLSKHLLSPHQVIFDRTDGSGTPFAKFLKRT